MSNEIRDLELHGDLPQLNSPILIVMLQGWIDAAGAANDAMSAIESQIDPLPVATFDPDVFIDYRARRPSIYMPAKTPTAAMFSFCVDTNLIQRGIVFQRQYVNCACA
jgi:hypothetical protein